MRKWEQLEIPIALLILGIVAYGFFRFTQNGGFFGAGSSKESLSESDQPTPNYVVKNSGLVRQKSRANMFWEDITSLKPRGVQPRDSIFTGNNGRATLKLSGKQTLTIDPNSLVVVTEENTETHPSIWSQIGSRFFRKPKTIRLAQATQGIEIKSGVVHLELAANSSPLKVTVEGKKFVIHNPDETQNPDLKGGQSAQILIDAENPTTPIQVSPGQKLGAQDIQTPHIQIDPLPMERAPASEPSETPVLESAPAPAPSVSPVTPPTSLLTISSEKKDKIKYMTPSSELAVMPTPLPTPTATPAAEPIIPQLRPQLRPPALLAPAPMDVFPKQSLSLSAGYGFSTLNARDLTTSTTASLHTSHDFLLSASYEQQWSEGFSTFFTFTLEPLDFQPSTNPNKTLSDTSKTLTGFTLGAESELGSRVKLQYGGAYGDKLFLEGFSSSVVQVDALPVASLWSALGVTVYQAGSSELSLHGKGEFLFPTSSDTYTVNAGNELSAFLALKNNYGPEKKSSFEFDLGYRQRNENTSIMNLSESSVFAQITFHLPIFEATFEPDPVKPDIIDDRKKRTGGAPP